MTSCKLPLTFFVPSAPPKRQTEFSITTFRTFKFKLIFRFPKLNWQYVHPINENDRERGERLAEKWRNRNFLAQGCY